MTVHEVLNDGRVRELYKATGGAWGGTKVDEAFFDYFCEIFTKEVIERVKKEYPSDWVEMMSQFEKIKRTISLDESEEFVQMMLRPCIQEIYLEVMEVNLESTFSKIAGRRGATLDRHRLQIPKSVISEMIKEVAKSISTHTKFLLEQEENKDLNFLVMVGGFSNSPIVVQVVKDCVPSTIPVIVPENADLCVVQGAVMFGWRPEIIKSRKSKKSYGISTCMPFRENIDPERLIAYDGKKAKRCNKRFDKLVTVGEEIEIDQTVKRVYYPLFHKSVEVRIAIYISEESTVTYCDEPGASELGFIMVPMPNTTGGMDRKIEVEVRFGGTEIFVSGKDLTTGKAVQALYDFL